MGATDLWHFKGLLEDNFLKLDDLDDDIDALNEVFKYAKNVKGTEVVQCKAINPATK